MSGDSKSKVVYLKSFSDVIRNMMETDCKKIEDTLLEAISVTGNMEYIDEKARNFLVFMAHSLIIKLEDLSESQPREGGGNHDYDY